MDRLRYRKSDKLTTSASDLRGTVVAVGLEVHRTTVCLLEPIDGTYRLAAELTASSELYQSATEQARSLIQHLDKNLRRQLWDDQRDAPFTSSTQPHTVPPIEHLSLAASPRPRLRVWLAGLTASNSLAAAQSAVEATQAQIVGTTVLSADIDHQVLASDLYSTRPEALVLSGGFDTKETANIRTLQLFTRQLAAALQNLPSDAQPNILFAGNAYSFEHIAHIFQTGAGLTVRQVDNVCPAPGQTRPNALSQAVETMYRGKCKRMQGFDELEAWQTAESPAITVESSFARLTQLWASLNELSELYGVYVGSDRWLHVWADTQTDRILARYTSPGDQPIAQNWRPPLRLVSGPWPDSEQLPTSVRWYDKRGLAPVIAASARMSPQAALDVLRSDIFVANMA